MISDGSDDVAFKVNGDQMCWKEIPTSTLINREMTKIGQAAWLCGSLPLGCIITYLEKFFLFLNLSILPIRETVVWVQPLVIYTRYTQAKWVVGHVWAGLQDVLVEPSVFLSRDTLAEGGSIPCHVGNPISNKRHAVFDFILYMEREMQVLR